MNRKFLASYLIGAAENRDISLIKEHSYEAVVTNPDGCYLDIGCGPGIDTIGLAKQLSVDGRVIGIDADEKLIEEARSRAIREGLEKRITHRTCDAELLPFDSTSLDGCRCERLLQHLTPRSALAAFSEAIRVTRPGGRLVYIDTDWPSFSVHSPNFELERRLVTRHLNTIANPYAARGLPDLFVSHGLTSVSVLSNVVHLTADGVVRLLSCTLGTDPFWNIATQRDSFESWCGTLRRYEAMGRLYAAVTIITCVGVKPAASGTLADRPK